MVTETASPVSNVKSVPVSLSETACPSPANVPCSVSAKVKVPMPAEESRTQMPARGASVPRSLTGVRVQVIWFCPRR